MSQTTPLQPFLPAQREQPPSDDAKVQALPGACKLLPFRDQKLVCKVRVSDSNHSAVKCPKCTYSIMSKSYIFDEPMWFECQLPSGTQHKMTFFFRYCSHCLFLVPVE